MSKGSKRRPREVESEEFDARWEKAFRREKKNKKVMKPKEKREEL